jgi:hypothetical protein
MEVGSFCIMEASIPEVSRERNEAGVVLSASFSLLFFWPLLSIILEANREGSHDLPFFPRDGFCLVSLFVSGIGVLVGPHWDN